MRYWIKGGFGNILFQFAAIYSSNKPISVVTILTKKNFFTQKILKWEIHESKLEIFEFKESAVNLFKIIFTLLSFRLSLFLKKPFFGNLQSESIALNDIKDLKNYCSYSAGIQFNSKNKLGINQILNHLKNLKKSKALPAYENVFHFRGKDANHLSENEEKLKLLFNKFGQNIYIVTDDTEKCKSLGITNVISGELLDDFFILSNTINNFFLSDSTFSWWASHLCDSSTNIYMPNKLYERHGFLGNANLIIENE